MQFRKGLKNQRTFGIFTGHGELLRVRQREMLMDDHPLVVSLLQDPGSMAKTDHPIRSCCGLPAINGREPGEAAKHTDTRGI